MDHSLTYNFHLRCCYKSCQETFQKYLPFHNHIIKFHQKQDQERESLIYDYHIKCVFTGCKKTSPNVKSFKKHFYDHIKENIFFKKTEKYSCIYEGCTYTTVGCDVKQKFYDHFSKFHRDDFEVECLKSIKNFNNLV